MKRCNNWPRALADFINEREAMSFAWGSNDCCMFAADWVNRLVGVDPSGPWRGQYDTKKGAAFIISRKGGSVLEMATVILDGFGWPKCDPKLARRGDVVCVETPTGPALGVCAGRDSFTPGESGLVAIPTLQALAAWRVG